MFDMHLKGLSAFTVLLLVSFLTQGAGTKTLSFAYDVDRGEPFHFIQEKQLISGIVYDFGVAIAIEMKRRVVFLEIPSKRRVEFLVKGHIDAWCLVSPTWFQNPEDFHWSETLYEGQDLLITHHSFKHQIEQFEDLAGKSVSTRLGYVYHPRIMEMFSKGETRRQDHSLTVLRYEMLSKGRIDVLIESNIVFGYQMLLVDKPRLYLKQPLIAEQYQQACAISRKTMTNADQEAFSKAVKKLKVTGQIQTILRRYRLQP